MTILAVLIVVGGGYHYLGKATPTKYVLAKVEKGSLIVSIAGSGQVSVANQVDIKPKVSGAITYAATQLESKPVRVGTIIAQIDAKDALKAVRNAQINVQSAQISLAKLQASQADSPAKLQDSITNTQNELAQAYTSGFTNVSNTFLDLPSILTQIHDILYGYTAGTSSQQNADAYQELIDRYQADDFRAQTNQIKDEYNTAVVDYNRNFNAYKVSSSDSDAATIEALIDETLKTTTLFSQSIKDEQNLLDTLVTSMNQYQQKRPIPPAITQYQTTIATSIAKLNADINNLTSIKNTIVTNKQNLASTQRDLATSKTTDPLDVASAQNVLEQRQSDLTDARNNLADYAIRSPFDGILAKIDVHRGDSASPATAVATVITSQEIAEIPLNEVDVSKVKIGQQATLNFDAIPDFTITGKVTDIDTLGTVTQGVVNYTVKVALDTQDARIKPGMSVLAHIVTDVKQDALMIPNSALKSQGNSHYVQITNDARAIDLQQATIGGIVLQSSPVSQTVEIGESNDTMTEITNGLKEGDTIITRTITSTATAATQSSARSPFGGIGGGGAAARGLGR